MCNPAEEAEVTNASDSKRSVHVSATDNLVTCHNTSACISADESKANGHPSNGCMVDVADEAGHFTTDSLIETDVTVDDQPPDTSEHSAKEAYKSRKGGQEFTEEVNHSKGSSNACTAMATSFPEGDGITKDDVEIHIIPFKDFSKTSLHHCNSNLVECEDDGHPMSARYRMVKSTEEVNHSKGSSNACTAMATSFREGDGITKDDVEIRNIPFEDFSKTSLHHCHSNLVVCEDDGHPMSAEYRMVKSTPIEADSLSERMASERENSRIERVESEEEALQETIVGAQADASDGENAKSSTSAVVEPLDSTSLCDETESCGKASDELCTCPNNGFRKPEREIHMVHADDGLHTVDNLLLGTLEESSEDNLTGPCNDINGVVAVKNSDSSFGEKKQVLKNLDEPLAGMNGRPGPRESVVEQIASVMAISSTEDASEHVPSSFKEATEETTSEIEQEDCTPSVQVQVTEAVVLEGNGRPELARFFNNARGPKLEKEIEEQECAPALAKLPIKNKIFMESPRSLRMLLFSEETALVTKKEEKHRKDGKCMEFSSKVVPEAESHSDDNHTEHNYPSKWYEDADNAEISSAFSGPIAFSGALTYQGLISFSGQVPNSGNISHRSDSSTSTRSFAFPILASEWNSSPVKMGAPDPRFYRKQRKWYFCFCCARPSTLFD